ncbi:MAG TPA: TIGR01459 family HAD-type hydrolase [Hellea balneolensis]|uniref:TIGR01459 family HAD-type hydrolase n=1 Tax=Hellea balneolensis TaxID=287478 RepID=A0A7C5QQE8_9PROT|nr:TIGR01459 family HAD-type hydrolase [Hellea balneolensis]
MNTHIDISGLGQIAEDYDALLVDIWGVIHNGKRPFIEAVEALERFKHERGPVVLISNSPRPSVAIPAQFDEIGVPHTFYDAIVTSGDATIDELARRAPGPAFKLGPARDDRLYENLDLNFSELETAKFITCTGLFDDEHETPDDYRDLLSQARDLNLPLVCANPDVQVHRGDKLIYCGGALANVYEDMDGQVIYAGKPHDPIYRLSRVWLKEVAGYDIPNARILAIGDNIHTDLLGAQNQGMDCLFIADGVHSGNAEQVRDILKKHGIFVKYMLPSLRW